MISHLVLSGLPALFQRSVPQGPSEEVLLAIGVVVLVVLAIVLAVSCFSVVWNFFVYQRLSDSYKAYFDSVGRYDVGDCGKSLGLVYCICVCMCFIPYLNFLAGTTALVLWIVYVVKGLALKAMIPENAAVGAFMPAFRHGGYPPKAF